MAYFIQELLGGNISLEEFYDYAKQFPFAKFFLPNSFKVNINGEPYKIGPYISKGSFGSVYKATDEFGTMVAIKLITPRGTAKETNLLPQKADKEIGFLKALNGSANVIIILNSEINDSSVAIVMEYCSSSLQGWMEERNIIKGHGLASKEVVRDFVPFLSSAVQQMRTKNIVHFDLKPGNILRCGVRMFGK